MACFETLYRNINSLLWRRPHHQKPPKATKLIKNRSKYAKNRKPDRRFQTGFFLRFRAVLFKKPTNRG